MKQQGTIKALQVLYWAMLLGLVLFACIAFFLKYTDKFPSSMRTQDQLLQVIAIAVSFAAVFIGSSNFRKKILQIRNSFQPVSEKAAAYRSACILQWALLEVSCLFCIICFLLVGNLAFIGLAAALMFWFALTNPSKMKIMLLLGLSEEEMEDF